MVYVPSVEKTELGRVAPESVNSGLLLGAAGAVIGAAISIVTGTNVGAAAGLVVGGGHGYAEHYENVQLKIKDDL
jgi:hypothetical protein